jgi:hypothetical protein
MRDEYVITYPVKYSVIWILAGGAFSYLCADGLWFHQIPGASRGTGSNVVFLLGFSFCTLCTLASLKNLFYPSPIIRANPAGIIFFGCGSKYKKGLLVPWKSILSISACRIHEDEGSTNMGLRIACHASVALPKYIDGQTEFTGPDNSEYLITRGYLSDTPESVTQHLTALMSRYKNGSTAQPASAGDVLKAASEQ